MLPDLDNAKKGHLLRDVIEVRDRSLFKCQWGSPLTLTFQPAGGGGGGGVMFKLF